MSFSVFFQNIVHTLESIWWIILPIILFFILWDRFLKYQRRKFRIGLRWVLLEIKVPRDVLKTPKAMEQIFAGLHAILRPRIRLFTDRLYRGVVQEWLSFEMVGRAGEIHFYVATPSQYRNFVEAQIYAQYPDAEIQEVDDYVNFVPQDLPDEEFDLYGTELTLARESAYPIRTYPYFEEAKAEEQRLDPLSVISETLSRLQSGEMLWIQLLARPVDEKWKDKARELVDRLMGRRVVSKGLFGWVEAFFYFLRNLITAIFTEPTWPEGVEEKKPTPPQLTSGEKEIIEAIERKIGKLGFEAGIRIIYIDKRKAFTRSNIVGVLGAFRQFNTQTLNGLVENSDIDTDIARIKLRWWWWFFKGRREYLRKKKIFRRYKWRRFVQKHGAVFNVEELATIYHFPTIMVETPTLERIEAIRKGPPPGLPVE